MAAILWRNLADTEFGGSVTASSWIATSPPTRLQNPHTLRRWKGRNGAAESILVTWTTEQTFDSIGLMKLAKIVGDTTLVMSSAATKRVRVSSVDLTGIAGDVYDSGVIAGKVRDAYGCLIELFPAPVTGKAVLIDISESGVDAILAGRLVIGLRKQFALNFSYDWSDGYADLSRIKKSIGGQTYVDRDDRYRVLNIPFNSIVENDFNTIVRAIDRENGLSRDVLFVIDENSAELDRDSVWGLIKDMSPATQPNLAYFSKRYAIEERR
jgi:hypothetical protein